MEEAGGGAGEGGIGEGKLRSASIASSAGTSYDLLMPPILSTATLTIRNLDGRVKERLRVRAAKHGRSMEAEARVILADALADANRDEGNLVEAIRKRMEPLGGAVFEPHPSMPLRDPPNFGE